MNEEKQTHPSYSPDAVLPKNGKAAVTILFNYNTDEEKEWFDGIRKLELVEYDEQKNTINSSLVFDSEKNVAHGQGRVGQLTIQTGQSNFYNNGRYYVRLYRRQAVPRSSRFMSSMRQYRRWSLRKHRSPVRISILQSAIWYMQLRHRSSV